MPDCYVVLDARGSVLARLRCPVDAHHVMRVIPEATEWRLPSGVVGGRKVAARKRVVVREAA